MNIPNSALAPALAAVLALGLAACNPRHTEAQRTAAADPSAVVIGTTPAPPSGDPPGTTPVDPDGATEVSKAAESAAMPLPGQPNDHSNVAAAPSQRAGTSDAPTPESPASTTQTSKAQ
ncbi:MAG: hypothetical protein ACXWG1_11100 [Usitatibacter sp.]